MTLTGPGILFQESTVGSSAQKLRDAFWGLLAQSGVSHRDDLKVSAQSPAPDQTVRIATGAVFLAGTSAGQGAYTDYNDASYTQPMPAAHASLSRWDVVVYRVLDADLMGTDPNTSGTGTPHFTLIDNQGHFDYVQGTPSSSPAVPTLFRDMIPLAYVFRSPNDNVINNSDITDVRPYASALGGNVVCTSTTRPANPRPGDQIFETDTRQTYTWDGFWWNSRSPMLKSYVMQAGQLGYGARISLLNATLPTLVSPMPSKHIMRISGSYGYADASHDIWARAWDRKGVMYFPGHSGDYFYHLWADGGVYRGFALVYMQDYNAGETIGGAVIGADWYSEAYNTFFDLQMESTWISRTG